jgi:uncharacterized protein (TIGR03086 family)
MIQLTRPVQDSDVTAESDPRDALAGAIELAGEVIAAVRPADYATRTPCPAFTVRQMCNHMVSVLRRTAVLGAGGSFFSVPHFADDVVDGEWPTAWANTVRDVETVWSDPAILGREIRLPWTTVSGAAFAVMYANELTLHTWDVAKATGQRPDWDPVVLAVLLDTMEQAIPAEPRGEPVPFGPVVPVPDDAPAIDRLVGWYGRQP